VIRKMTLFLGDIFFYFFFFSGVGERETRVFRILEEYLGIREL
jgi:hypothetical protein